jgi:hypothetical protein
MLDLVSPEGDVIYLCSIPEDDRVQKRYRLSVPVGEHLSCLERVLHEVPVRCPADASEQILGKVPSKRLKNVRWQRPPAIGDNRVPTLDHRVCNWRIQGVARVASELYDSVGVGDEKAN